MKQHRVLLTILLFWTGGLCAQTLDIGLSAGAGAPITYWPKGTYFHNDTTYQAQTRYSASVEIVWVSKRGFGVKGSLLYIDRASMADSVSTFSGSMRSFSRVETKASTLFLPIQFVYRVPFRKFYTQLSAGVMPGILLHANIDETALGFPQTAFVNYGERFEIGVLGEVRLAYEVVPRLSLGANMLYFRSELDIEISPLDFGRFFVDQYTNGFLFSLSANWTLK